MSNLTVRILFALVGIPIVLLLIWYGSASRLGMMTGLIMVAAWEWSRMVAVKVPGPSMALLSPIAALLFVAAWIALPLYSWALQLAVAIVLSLYILVGFARVGIQQLFPWIALHLSGPLYVALWGGMLLRLMGEGQGFSSSAAFILVMVAMWTCDTFAYFFGRLFGKHKMAPEISPKKTWEGAFGGTLFTVGLVVWLGPWAFHTGLWANVVMGVVLSIAGQAGDLLESVLKRWADAKDSSHAFPGHGGVLDRLDSLFLAGPLAAIVLAVVKAL